MSESFPGESPYLMPHISFDDPEVWNRKDLQVAVREYAHIITRCMREGFNVSEMGLKTNNHKDTLTYVSDADNWSGYLVTVLPETAKLRTLSVSVAKVDRRDYTFTDDSAKTFTYKPGEQSLDLFRELDHEELIALANVFSNVMQGSNNQEDPEMLHQLFLNGYLDYPTEASVTIKQPRSLRETKPENDNLLDEIVVNDAVERLATDGEHEAGLPLHKLNLAMNIGGLIYLAELNRHSQNKVDSIRIICLQDQNILDSLEVDFDGGTQIIHGQPKSDMYWNSSMLSELFISGQKIERFGIEEI